MTAFAPFDAAWADPGAEARAWGAAVGYLANTVPVELIRAAGFFAQQVTGSPADATPDALHHMEPVIDGAVLSVFQRWLDGRLNHLAALVVPRSSEGLLQLYYHMREIVRTDGLAGRPEPILFDILHTPHEATARYNAGRLDRLKARLEALSGRPIADADVATAIHEANGVRQALSALNALRVQDRPRLTGTQMLRIAHAATVMAPGRFRAAAEQGLAATRTLPERDGPRLLLTGSGHDDDGFHRLVEAMGATIAGDDHASGDWWFLDPVGPGDPMQALLLHYHRHAPSPRSFPREKGDRRLLQAAERSRPDGAIFFTEAHDDTLGFDYPTQRDLLRERGIPVMFLKEQSYRRPDRAAQAAAVSPFLAALPQREAAR
ncbi:2-hydroxyacyl-CoA dehydratase family protein [Psychromarinibacter sp. C21-152]|uniref:2-hydroxyacyl-CoA dehydratase family protein n=1 Tax=Psychromarinibacter sediminicola TaxID=3033385 RepID=A0AAE3T6I0_9RHOB|nr:2-hydroxyacyl-CoA dehydratase family protein [Psychromarinibacter sediminicola]MDF0599300.1 2-hydroxyacyl-CoA dehydratase family protein [Psychromarinibacter sediminicola]